MANRTWQADIVVGIDFGMTCTGVAYSTGPEWTDPKTIQHWPGKLGHEIRNKVNSSVSYDLDTGNLTTWGFLCDPDDESLEYNEMFKLHLDPNYDDPLEDAPPIEDASRWYQDYLQCLYKCIMKHFEDKDARFGSKKIDFVFSVPVTWRENPSMLAHVEKLIRAAGFGKTTRERACVYLTEAEAAAISASKQSMEKGDVFLVCDAGGGTTDLNVLKVACTDRQRLELHPLSWTEGQTVGSTVINFKMRAMVRERLALVQNHIEGNLESTVSQMMRDKFERFKCSFGTAGYDVPLLQLPIPGMAPGLEFTQARIEDSKIVITREELQAIFDEQIQKMFNLIDSQIRVVAERHARETISYLVLSGGLGSSQYIQDRIKSRYEKGLHSGVDPIKVLLAEEPQLSVVHGLVMARVQANRGGPDMYSLRCCPLSYGILCRELYDPVKHQGEKIEKDPFDGKRWAERQITWIIRKGELVSAESGARQRYRLKLPMGQEDNPWKTRIVMSKLPANQLPSSMRGEGASEVCAVEVVLNHGDMKRKNRHWYNLGKEYNRAEFEVRMLIGAGLRFEIWSKDGLRSKTHDEIEVEWESADGKTGPALTPAQEHGYGIYTC